MSAISVNGQTLLSQVSYQPFGPTTGWQWGNGTSTVRQYDTDGRLTYLSSAGSSTFSYFPDGLIKTRTDDVPVSPPLPAGSTAFGVSAGSVQTTFIQTCG